MNNGVVQQKKRTMDERLGLFTEMKNYRLKKIKSVVRTKLKKESFVF